MESNARSDFVQLVKQLMNVLECLLFRVLTRKKLLLAVSALVLMFDALITRRAATSGHH